MRIAIPRETHPGENRVPIIPAVAKKLVKMGAELVVESGMGTGSGYTDADYTEKGVKIVGATSHYASEDLDMGPIIAQETETVNHGYSPADIIQIGRSIESRVLATAVKAHAEDRIIVFKGRTIVFT